MTFIKYFLIALFISLPFNGFAGLQQSSDLPEKRPWGSGMTAYQAVDKDKNGDSFPTLTHTAELTLAQALTLALIRNPKLAAFSWEIRARKEMTQQAKLRPNPEIGIVVENILGEDESRGVQAADTTLQLSQLIELGGKRASRQLIANLERDLAGWDYETTRLDIIAKTSKAFFALLTTQERLQLGRENLKLAQEVFNTVKLRVEAGKASPLEESRAQVMVNKSRIALDKNKRELAASRYQLSSTWGASQPHFTKIADNRDKINEPQSLTSINKWLAQNPEISRQRTEIDLQKARLSLAKATGIPDMTVGGGIKRHEDNDNYTFLFGVSMALPVFDRNQGGIRAAQADVAVRESQHRNVEIELKTALSQSHEALQAAYSEVNSLQKQILPIAKETFESINYGYRQGQFEFLDVLDAQRTLIELKEQLINSLQEYHNQRINIEHLISQELALVN